jgi:hypothetical protein
MVLPSPEKRKKYAPPLSDFPARSLNKMQRTDCNVEPEVVVDVMCRKNAS